MLHIIRGGNEVRLRTQAGITAAVLGCALSLGSACALAGAHGSETQTPIRHLVVIFQENVSFDHYFGTYPRAANPPGEPAFHVAPGTPVVNGLNDALLTDNPNHDADGNVANPERLDRSEALTCDEDHGYTAEQMAFDGGLMDKFVLFTDREGCNAPNVTKPNLVMDYYDGNTVTALWNYAQHFAMNDNSFGTVFGPSTPGALNLVSGQTHGATPANVTGVVVDGTVIGDPDPSYDDCSNHSRTLLAMSGTNVGNLLNQAGVTWGWFEGGFKPTSRAGDGTAVCGSTHKNIGGSTSVDYIPHHEPFQYYASTANPHHLPPSSVAAIGHTDQANHQYDLSDFWAAAEAGNLPAVSFLKASGYQDGHAGYSDPLDEQRFLVDTINRLEQLPSWKSTAVIIAYDDSDGWYDHVMGPIVTQSSSGYDNLVDGTCGANLAGGYPGRCGYGPRLPLLVVSPWARRNFVAHNVTDQSSVLGFIETNWHLPLIGDQSADAKAGSIEPMFDFAHEHGARRLFLDPATGEVKRRGQR